MTAALLVCACAAGGPPLEWRSWNLYEGAVSQELLQAQVDGLVRVRHDGRSLLDVGYSTIGLDDGWQACGPNGYHDETTGVPLVNLTRFPDMKAMTAYAATRNVKMGFYGNNCMCHGKSDIGRYTQDAEATVRFGFAATKVDSCGPETNITAWREALDVAATAHGVERIQLENCRNYAYTQHLTPDSVCTFDLFRSTEDNAPHFGSIMHNLMTNAQPPGAHGNVHGGLPVSHPGCWSYPDMLEVVGSGACRQDLKAGTCGHASPTRPAGGLDLNESRAHFGAWCVVSSPLTLSHDLTDDEAYDRAWPVVGNVEAVRVNQAYAGDAGRLVAAGKLTADQELYHGAGCECVYSGTLPQWAVFAKRLDGSMAANANEAAAIAINFSNDTLAAATIAVPLDTLFKDADGSRGGRWHAVEADVWSGAKRDLGDSVTWQVPQLAARSSFFVTIKRHEEE